MKEVRLIDANKLMQMIPTEEYNARLAIANAPTVDAEPIRHGHWEWNDYGGFGNYHCSVCKYIPYKYVPYTKFPRKPHQDYMYCPKCGAKMDERTEDVEIR